MIRRLTYLAAMLAVLAGCHGNSNREQPQAAGDTFYSSQYNGSNRDHQQRNIDKPNNTGEYRSTGDANLLEVRLPQRLDNQTVRYKAITVYYNKHYRLPNCVAYELTNTQVSMSHSPDAEKRENYQFNRDEKVSGCPDWWEYKESGYDRGHMAPAMDMRWDKQAMQECFYMTNICPQDHELNDGEWRHMEEAIHSWARTARRLVIFTGPVLEGNMSKMGKKGNIAVPRQFYKVVHAPEQDRAIAFLFKNEKAHHSWTNYAVTVDEVERLTGIDFLSSLPDDSETVVESKQNIKDWPKYFPRR